MTMTQPKPGTFRAICDECGQVRRTTSRAGYGKTGDWRDGRPRCMVPLKCSHCGIRTMHAYIRDFVPARYADDCERADAQQLEPEAVLEAIGVRPVYVEHLGRDALLIDNASIVLIDAGLPVKALAQIVAQVLKAALVLSPQLSGPDMVAEYNALLSKAMVLQGRRPDIGKKVEGKP